MHAPTASALQRTWWLILLPYGGRCQKRLQATRVRFTDGHGRGARPQADTTCTNPLGRRINTLANGTNGRHPIGPRDSDRVGVTQSHSGFKNPSIQWVTAQARECTWNVAQRQRGVPRKDHSWEGGLWRFPTKVGQCSTRQTCIPDACDAPLRHMVPQTPTHKCLELFSYVLLGREATDEVHNTSGPGKCNRWMMSAEDREKEGGHRSASRGV